MTYAYVADPIIDALLQLVELPDGWKEPSDAPPPVYRPNTLYAWEARPQEPRSVQMDQGLHPEVWFFIRFAYSVGTGEANGQTRTKAATEAIDGGIGTIAAAIAGNPVSELWEGIEVERMDPNAIVTFEVRAAHVDVAGYRLV